MSKLANPLNSVADWFRPGTTSEESGSGPMAVEARPRENQEKPQRGWFFRKPGRKQEDLAQLQRGYEDVVDLMESCKSHMESQAQRADRLLELLEDLPQALRVIPESSRQQAHMIEGLQKHLESQNQNTAKLSDAVTNLATATQQHEKAMGVIQKQLDANQQNGERMVESFSALGDTLGRIGAAHQSGNNLLNTMAETVKQSDNQMRELFNRNQRQVTMMSMISWTLAISALVVAGYIGVKVSQMPIGQSPAMVANGDATLATADAGIVTQASAPAAPSAATPAPAGKTIPLPQETAAPAASMTTPASRVEAQAAPVTVESVLADELIERQAAPAATGGAADQAAALHQTGQAIGEMLPAQMQQWMQQNVAPLVEQLESAAPAAAQAAAIE